MRPVRGREERGWVKEGEDAQKLARDGGRGELDEDDVVETGSVEAVHHRKLESNEG